MENNIDLLVKILSAGVIASFVTGVFSLIISIRNNSRLLKIEKMKQKYTMDSKRYELLSQYLNLLNEKGASFEYEGKLEMTFQCVRELFGLRLDKFKFFEKEHDEHKYLFDNAENEDIKTRIVKINNDVSEYVDRFREVDSAAAQSLVDFIDKMTLGIDDFIDFYLELIKKKMNIILSGE